MTEVLITKVDLLRHGLPEKNDCLLGRSDLPLSNLGWQQLHKATEELEGYDLIVSSGLRRCQAFAKTYAAEKKLPLTIESDWQEMNFGVWDGHSYEWLHHHNASELSNFWRDPWTHTPPEGESLSHFYNRVQSAWEKLLEHRAGSKILLVCHSGVIRMLLSLILGMDISKSLAMSRLHIPYASLTRIEVYRDEQGKQWPRVMFVNGREENYG
ncbi:histidine phosphatase family protein [Endozoicomonas numazuensis]|uniref:Alpha-ribazole phosphatase n=1 Tax=Endozoicomonas numazuensis TaxID=1137799 RepID=A0A081NM15_9GAMM|nr:alpha-ribazole phosphatase family protein [Endozoicomonas numazuensis]KEQ19488.1 hypothetical protein GZ78_06035 [Endozoicomonas numazuensis]